MARMDDSMGVEWTPALVIRLIQEYERRRELWDSGHDLYRVHTAKHELWEEMAAIFDCEVPDLKKKLNSILASHRREKAKVRNGARTGWFLYHHLSFLPTHVSAPPDDSGPLGPLHHKEKSEDEMLPEEYLELASDDMEEVEVKQERGVQGCAGAAEGAVARRRVAGRPRLLKPARRTRAPPQHPAYTDVLKTLRKSDLLRKKDECDAFGEYIANSLRKHDERTRSMIKHAINNILFEQEMKRYSVSAGVGAGQYEVADVDEDHENPLILGDIHHDHDHD